MNAITKIRAYREDQTFLPAALEVLETPPSPVRLWLLLAICGFVAIALVWGVVGKLDVVAAAAGKIIPIGKVKVVQPLQTGRIASILVANGDRVSTGQPLAMLDDRDVAAQLADQKLELSNMEAEIARRKASIAAARLLQQSKPDDAVPAIVWPADVATDAQDREQEVFGGDLEQLRSSLGSLDAQLLQKQAEVGGLDATIGHQKEYVAALDERVSMRQALIDKDAGSRADWLDATGNLKAQEVILAEEVGQLATSQADSKVLEEEWDKARDGFIDDNVQKLSDALRQVDILVQRVRQADVAVERMVLRSPIDGVVQASTMTSIGQVLPSGAEVARIVPLDAPIEVEAYLPNADVGFVHAGQKAVVKIDAFPFTRYGTIEGKVLSVGKDAIASSDAQQIEGDPAHAIGSTSGAGASQSLVFPVVVSLAVSSINADGRQVALSPGMGVTAEVDTGSRSILEYLFSPLVETASSALHER